MYWCLSTSVIGSAICQPSCSLIKVVGRSDTSGWRTSPSWDDELADRPFHLDSLALQLHSSAVCRTRFVSRTRAGFLGARCNLLPSALTRRSGHGAPNRLTSAKDAGYARSGPVR